MQPWRWEHPRVLIEHPDERIALALADRLRREGYSVGMCQGPDSASPCPLVGAGECISAHDADVIVSCLDDEDVLQALRDRCPGVPLVVATPTYGIEQLVGAVGAFLRA